MILAAIPAMKLKQRHFNEFLAAYCFSWASREMSSLSLRIYPS